VTFADFAAKLTPGTHTIDIRMTKGSEMPFSMGVNFPLRDAGDGQAVQAGLVTTLKDAKLAEAGLRRRR